MTRNKTKPASSTKSSILLMLCTLGSRMLGFVRVALINRFFGATAQGDVFHAIFVIPNTFRRLFAEGALSSSFIPVLSQTLIHDDSGKRSAAVVKNVITLQLLFLVPFSILSYMFPDFFTDIFTDFSDEQTFDMASTLYRYFIHYLLLISVSAILMAVLNAHREFIIPGITPLVFSIAVIASILLFRKELGIYSTIIGVLAGGLFQLLFQYPFFHSLGYRLALSFNLKNPDFRDMLKSLVPIIATASIFSLNQIIANRFASSLEVGSPTQLQTGLIFFQLPYGVFFASVATVLFPKMARQHARNDVEGLRDTIQYGLRFLFALLIPSTILCVLLGKWAIAVAFQDGKFQLNDTIAASFVLSSYAAGLFSTGAYNFLQRFCYASKTFKVLLGIAAAILVVDVAFSLLLMDVFGVSGLAIANTIAFSLGAVLLVWYVRLKLKRIHGKKILLSFVKILFANMPMIIIVSIFLNITGGLWKNGSSPVNWLLIIGIGLLSIAVLAISYYLFNIDFITKILKRKQRDSI